MDPDAALERIIEAALQGNADELRSAAEDLASWLDADGFHPTGYRLLSLEPMPRMKPHT